MDALLGIDYGTTSLKICLFDAQGAPLAQAGEQLQVDHPQAGWVEQPMAQSWEQASSAIRSVLDSAGLSGSSVKAVGVTGTFNLTMYGTAGNLLRQGILYGDLRLPSQPEIDTILREIGPEKVASHFGLEQFDEDTLTIILRVLHTPKLLWLREHEPHQYKELHSVITSSWDFINYRLTGEVSHAAGVLDLDLRMADLFNMPRAWFGKPCPVGEIAGTVSQEASAATGLAAGTPVVMGTTDSACAFLGAGLVDEGLALNAAGTTDVVAVALHQRPQSPVGYPVEHLVPGRWVLSLSPLRGPVLRWFVETFLPKGSSYADLDRLAAMSPPGAEGLLCLPYLMGEKGVVHDPLARGMLVGLDLHHGQSQMARAILEGVAFGVREILEAYSAHGYPWKALYLSGGGAKSALWNQIKADVLGRPVQLLRVLETGCMGAAVLAAVAMEHYPDWRAGSLGMAQVAGVLEPDPENHQVYDDAYQLYRRLYPQTRPVLAGLEAFREASRDGRQA